MIKAFVSFYRPRFADTIIYMLQSTEYNLKAYLAWLWHTQNFSHIMYRRTLDTTRRARALLTLLRIGLYVQTLLGMVLIISGIVDNRNEYISFGFALIIAAPVFWAHLIVVPIWLARILIVAPKERKMVKESEKIFTDFKGPKIAVAGSYGKTTMKELLATVLSEGKKVMATPGNKNVLVSHARFASLLEGDEDILIIEYGEGKPGDVEKFAGYTKPSHAVITGIAPAHLDQYKTLDAAAKDIFSATKKVKKSHVYVNSESDEARPYIHKEYETYDKKGALGWKVANVEVSITGTSFVMKKGKKNLELFTGLVGEHLLGPVAFASALAHELGLSDKEIIAGVARTKPYEHRMQPYPLSGGWVIDDTYNGNIEGVRAGTRLLTKLPARKKFYVTPGLVDQGEETERVHIEMGQLIAAAKPDIVVLMKNSVTQYIEAGLCNKNYQGEIRIETKPLEFYTNLDQFIAKDDLVLMQNDWTDNYR
jgi:UDP-N-acetylmuramyl pentapeptide synthase